MSMRFLCVALMLVSMTASAAATLVPGPSQDPAGTVEVAREALTSGEVRRLTSSFAPQVQLNLRGGESGYFSAGQAVLVLETYLRSRRLLHLSFSGVEDLDTNPYASGSAELVYQGSREPVQVYVALTFAGNRWVISRINIL